MKSFIAIASILLSATVSYAKAPAMLCKINDNSKYIEVVALEGGRVLVQLDAGGYLDGNGSAKDSVYGVYVEAENGSMYLAVDVKSDNGIVRFKYKDGTSYTSTVHCIYH